jgi:hypothetical protein
MGVVWGSRESRIKSAAEITGSVEQLERRTNQGIRLELQINSVLEKINTIQEVIYVLCICTESIVFKKKFRIIKLNKHSATLSRLLLW